MIDTHGLFSPLDQLEPVATGNDMRELIASVRGVHVADSIRHYVISLVNATRSSQELRLGASPRATLHLLRASRAYAALEGRDFVIPDDVQTLAVPVLAHRLLPTADAIIERKMPERVLTRLIERLPLPQRS
jgi:MoxR-like ATPase